MVPALRRAFNQSWTPERYQRFLELLAQGCGGILPGFRNCETPCFLPRAITRKLESAGADLIHQLTGNSEYRKLSDATIPERYNVPNESPLPMFLQVDFGLAEDLEPKLVEIQAFPSLYCYQPFLASAYRDAYELDPSLSCFLSGAADDTAYTSLLRDAIVAGHDPENVVLLEIDPQHQKTLCDFTLTEKTLGVRAVCLTKVKKRGRQLFYQRDGREVPIRRIYNRAIVDELERKNIAPGFDFRDDLDVEWAGHPNWYFRISKFSIPYLKHPSVPKTWFLDQMSEIPEDLDNYVLKPLYSFAGLGVVVGPTRADIDAVPAAARHEYILQERVNFLSVIETPHGPTKAEIRVMYVWTDELRAVTTIIRMGRGKMMGVDHNKNLEWVGASAAFVVD